MLNHNHTFFECEVLIESDWNLKFIICIRLKNWNSVLIESDWNLKLATLKKGVIDVGGINRIRLEFKDSNEFSYNDGAHSINRIRLEFKVRHH